MSPITTSADNPSKEGAKAPTIYDVARRAEVSHQTVTRYLHGYAGITAKTRSRVERALIELDYRPNEAARTLRSRRSNRIGVLADHTDHDRLVPMLRGMNSLAKMLGYVLDLIQTDVDDSPSVSASLASLRDRQVLGVVAVSPTRIVLDQLDQQDLPGQGLGEGLRALDAGADFDWSAGRCAADHLLELGHRHVGWIGGPASSLTAQARAAGFREAIRAGGGEVAFARHGNWSAESGCSAWGRLGASDREVTAVAGANDSIAVGIVSAAVRSGKQIPSDLSVIGIGAQPESPFVLPSLSTVVIDFEGQGRRLLCSLLRLVEVSVTPPPTAVGAPYVVARESTATPPVTCGSTDAA